MSKQDDTLALMAQAHEDERAQAAANKAQSLDKASEKRTWPHINGEDVSRFILQRMDELEDLDTPQDPERKGELKGHEAELQIISDHLRRLDEERQAAGPRRTGEPAQPPTYFFLTVAGDSVVVEYEDTGQKCSYTIKDIFDWDRFITDRRKEANRRGLSIRVMASSSMDFSQEYTKDKSVVDLARAIRSKPINVVVL